MSAATVATLAPVGHCENCPPDAVPHRQCYCGCHGAAEFLARLRRGRRCVECTKPTGSESFLCPNCARPLKEQAAAEKRSWDFRAAMRRGDVAEMARLQQESADALREWDAFCAEQAAERAREQELTEKGVTP